MNILLVDDDLLVLKALSTILEKNNHRVADAMTDGKKAVETYKNENVDIVILDIRMKEINGVDIALEILNFDENAKILLLTTFEDREDILRGLENGVLGILLKDNITSLIPAIESISLGNRVLDSSLKFNIFENKNKAKKFNEKLTEKEIEIIELIAKGLSNREIAEKLYLGEGTVRNYISTILAKLELRDRTQIVVYYYN